jgi:glycosyltransferase involved in cell wall biosynthesis
VMAGGYLQCQGNVRIPLAITGALLAIVGTAVGVLTLVAAGAGLAAVSAIIRVARHHRPESRPATSEALPQLSTDPFGSLQPLWSALPTVDVTIVVPFLNPDPAQLRAHIGRVRAGLESAGHSYEVIAVDDGSTNGAGDHLRRVPWRNVVVVSHTVNRGKGGALATGFTRARGGLIGFIDADGDIDPSHLAAYVDEALHTDADIVLADKTHPDSSNGSSSGRQLTSRVMHLINRGLRLSVVDTQTGAKLYRRELVQEAIPRMWENGFAFDVELFVMAQHLAFDKVVSMPVSIERDGGSTVSLRSTLRTGVRVLGIARRMLLADYYYGPRTKADAALRNDIASIQALGPEVAGT